MTRTLALTLNLTLCLTLLGGVRAQADPVAALDELLRGGYYALAAQVEGPQVVRARPRDVEARLLYARALYLAGSAAEAERQLAAARALPATPEQKRALEHLGALVQAARGDAAEAARRLGKLYRAAPDYGLAMDWGQVAWQGGDLRAAERAYRAAAATPRGQREPWPTLNLARLLLQRGDPQGAIGPLEATLTRLEGNPGDLPSPAYAEAFFRLGQAYEALGDPQAALPNYQAARSVDRDYAPALSALERLGEP